MSNDEDGIADASGAISLGILEKIAKRLSSYDKNSNFEQTYYALEKEEYLLN